MRWADNFLWRFPSIARILLVCRGSLSPCDSISRTCRAAYPACAKPVSALIIAPEVAFPCALYAAQCGKTVRGLLTHSDDDPVQQLRFVDQCRGGAGLRDDFS